MRVGLAVATRRRAGLAHTGSIYPAERPEAGELNGAGYPIQRIADYNDWLQRFETAMRALPQRQRQHSVLPLRHYYQRPEKPLHGAFASTNASTPRCRRRKSARTKTSHTLRPSSSSNT